MADSKLFPLCRNVMMESARFSHGQGTMQMNDLSKLDVSSFDAVIFPGGHGIVKNLWETQSYSWGSILKQIEMFFEKKLNTSQKKCSVLTEETIRVHLHILKLWWLSDYVWIGYFIVCHPRSITIPGAKILLSCFTVSKQMVKSKWKCRRLMRLIHVWAQCTSAPFYTQHLT